MVISWELPSSQGSTTTENVSSELLMSSPGFNDPGLVMVTLFTGYFLFFSIPGFLIVY